jgi:gamma-glutamylcysteine synthetase
MDAHTIRPLVEKLFSRGEHCTVGTAVEQELFAMGFFPGSSVNPDRVRDAIAGSAYEQWVSFEPGGQVELSLPRMDCPTAAVRHLEQVTAALAADLMPHSIVLAARPVREQDPATPRYLQTARYDAMERHLDTLGPAGRRMMRSTASTQVCLDWWPGSAGLEQWRVLLLAAPFIAAATARSHGPTGRLTTWLELDPSRTAFDGRLLQGDDPVAAYTDFAASAEIFVVGGVEEHLSTLFPPVRPRGRYLEVRFPDARPAAVAGELISGLAGLMYDDQRRRNALELLAPEQHRLADHWAAAAAGTLDAGLGLALLDGTQSREQVAA